jgi:hypothetical protein
MISAASVTHSSQIATPGPTTRCATDFFDLKQKLHVADSSKCPSVLVDRREASEITFHALLERLRRPAAAPSPCPLRRSRRATHAVRLPPSPDLDTRSSNVLALPPVGTAVTNCGGTPASALPWRTERPRSRTEPAWGCQTSPVLKTDWATGPCRSVAQRSGVHVPLALARGWSSTPANCAR